MKSFPSLLAISTVLALAGQGTAQAQDFALSFELDAPAAAPEPQIQSEPASEPESLAEPVAPILPLPIPENGANPPVSRDSGSTISAGRYGGGEAIALAQSSPAAAAKMLPSPPPLVGPDAEIAAKPETAPAIKQFVAENVALTFWDQPEAAAEIAQSKTSEPPISPSAGLVEQAAKDEALPFDPFAGGSDSLVARIVGSAEGTRTPDGRYTGAYFGHNDPGNGVWNMGTFSYQHGAETPEEADRKQLDRLKSQTQVLTQKAADKGIELTFEEKLNGIDLANQSPLAAIGRVGYIDRLAEARQLGLTGEEAIVHARTRSYINPDTNRWNAPGLGNTAEGVTRDQTRRMNAISQALDAYQQQYPDALEPLIATSTKTVPTAERAPSQSADQSSEPQTALPDDVPFRLWEVDTKQPPAPSAKQPAANPIQRSEAETAPDLATEAAPISRVYAPKSTVPSPQLGAETAATAAASIARFSTAEASSNATSEQQQGILPATFDESMEENKPAALEPPASPEAIDTVLNTDLPSDPL